MRLIFNELSLINMPHDNRRISEIMVNFIKCFNEAMKSSICFEREIITCINFNNIIFNNGFSTAKWRNSIDRDTSMIFKRMCERQININDIDDKFELSCEHGIDGIGKGLLLAYLNGDVAISFASHTLWENFYIDAILFDISNFSKEKIRIENIANINDMVENYHQLTIMSRQEALECRTSEQLINNIRQLFPYLIFHSNAIDQLNTKVETQHIRALIRKLHEINEYFSTWNIGAFDPKKFKTKISPESTITLQKYKEQHTFTYENEEFLVSYHLRYTGNIAGRIYFHPHEIFRKGIICSLTTKLPAVNDQ